MKQTSIVILLLCLFTGLCAENIEIVSPDKNLKVTVSNTSSGMGLMKCGSVVIPFDNQISKSTDLYKLYNTNIHEKIAEMKARDKAQIYLEEQDKCSIIEPGDRSLLA